MTVGESEPFWFNYVNDLPDGDSLSAIAWTLAVAANSDASDPDPQSHLDGLPGIIGTLAGTRISGLLANVTYILTGTATTAAGNTLILYSHIQCESVS